MTQVSKLEERSYWMVTGEWLQVTVTEDSPIATPGNLNPQQPKLTITRQTKTDFINCHPAKFVLLMQQERPNYSILNQLQISRAMFEEIQGLQAAAQAANNGGQPELGEPSEQDSVLESNELSGVNPSTETESTDATNKRES